MVSASWADISGVLVEIRAGLVDAGEGAGRGTPAFAEAKASRMLAQASPLVRGPKKTVAFREPVMRRFTVRHV